jgi:hypothetical protein
MTQEEIEIKSPKTINLAIPNKLTIYLVVTWINGMPMTSTHHNKADAERSAFSYLGPRMSVDHVEILKIELDVPLKSK